MSQQETNNSVVSPSVPSTGTMELVTSHSESFSSIGGGKLSPTSSLSLTRNRSGKSTKVIGDIGYAFWKEFEAQGWFTGTGLL